MQVTFGTVGVGIQHVTFTSIIKSCILLLYASFFCVIPKSDLLETSWEAAKASQGYNYEKTRAAICKKFSEACGSKEPYPWQVDICKAILLGLDCIVITLLVLGRHNAASCGQDMPQNGMIITTE
jgi:hypothetical protein